jgi:hypothetical protein
LAASVAQDKRRRVAVALLAFAAVVLAVLLARRSPPAEPNDPDYYTGPRRAKWDQSVWVTPEGKIYKTAPPGIAGAARGLPAGKPGKIVNPGE